MKKSIAARPAMRGRDMVFRDMVFMEAIEPMEAAVLPAKETPHYGTLSMIPRACDISGRTYAQRAKIWVR